MVGSNAYGNGGGVFVTTSRHDDNFWWEAGWGNGGAGNGAAHVFEADGYFSSSSPNLLVDNNTATRWGGGIYAGISRPWYYIRTVWPNANNNTAVVHCGNGTVLGNDCDGYALRRYSAYKPAQVAAERVDGELAFDNATIRGTGNNTDHIGIYLRGCSDDVLSVINTTFLFVMREILSH
jgi:predicted outer membrane repeat protein